jgi:hypothetical protein
VLDAFWRRRNAEAGISAAGVGYSELVSVFALDTQPLHCNLFAVYGFSYKISEARMLGVLPPRIIPNSLHFRQHHVRLGGGPPTDEKGVSDM